MNGNPTHKVLIYLICVTSPLRLAAMLPLPMALFTVVELYLKESNLKIGYVQPLVFASEMTNGSSLINIYLCHVRN